MTDALDDEPLTLAEACNVIFRGRIKPSTLRAEAQRGRLTIERIGRTDFVTRRAIREMREKCVVVPQQKARGSGLSDRENAVTAASPLPAGASATTADTSVALTSLLKTAAELNKRSETTSRKSTRSRRGSLSLVKG